MEYSVIDELDISDDTFTFVEPSNTSNIEEVVSDDELVSYSEQSVFKQASQRVDYKQVFKKEIDIALKNKPVDFQIPDPKTSTLHLTQLQLIDSNDFVRASNSVLPNLPHTSLFTTLKGKLHSADPCPSPNSSSNEACIKYITIVNNALSMLNSNSFVLKVHQQVTMYTALKNKLDHKLSLEDKGHVEEFAFKYRFGDSLKDLFQGFDFEDVCRILLVCVHLKLKSICFQFDEDSKILTVYQRQMTSKQLLLIELLHMLTDFLKIDINSLFRSFVDKVTLNTDVGYLFSPNPVTSTLDNTSVRLSVEQTMLKELVRSVDDDRLSDITQFEYHDEVFLFWIANNFIYDEYVPLSFFVRAFSLSFLNLYAAVLNYNDNPSPGSVSQWIDVFIRFQSIEMADTEFKAVTSFIRRLLFGDCEHDSVIFVHKRMTLYKQRFESLTDFIYLLFVHDFEYVDESFLSSVATATTSNCSSSTADFNLNQFVTRNRQFCHDVITIWLSFQSQLLDTHSTSIIESFLSCATSTRLLKRQDSSYLVEHLRVVNQLFLEFTGSFRDDLNDLSSLLANKELMSGQCLFSDPLNFVCLKVNKITLLKLQLHQSADTRSAFIRKTENEMKVLANVSCFTNLDRYWNLIKHDFHLATSSPVNEAVPQSLRFSILKNDKGHYLRLPKTLNDKVKNHRRLIPEFVFDNSNWDYLRDMIGECHWKVQNGIFAWFSIFVANFNYRVTVLKLFRLFGLSEVKSRATAIKFFGFVSKLYRLIDDVRFLNGFTERFSSNPFIVGIPAEIMIDIDVTFGFCDTVKSENNVWDCELVEHLTEWLNRDSREILFGVDVCYDFELAFEHTTYDMKDSLCKGVVGVTSVLVFVENKSIAELDATIFALFGHSSGPRCPSTDCKSTVVCSNYHEYCHNYLNFTATGSAKRFKMKMTESREFTQLQVKSPAVYNEIKQYRSLNCVTKEIKPETNVSKTVCFGFVGEELPQFFIHVHGRAYLPELSCFLKKEAKKIRCVINADLVSFAKQSFIHDWIKQTLSCNVTSKINSLLQARDRLIGLYKMHATLNQEKWCVPIDLKNFEYHFGGSHYHAVGKVMQQRILATVKDDTIRRDLQLIFRHLGDDLAKGELTFSIVSDDKTAFDMYLRTPSNLFTVERINVNKAPQEHSSTGINVDKAAQEHSSSDVQPKSDDNVPLNTQFRYIFKFKVRNGLMSGWKMTSLFGSLFNLAINKMSQQFTICESADLAFDVNILGDDTHLKRRFLSGSLNHIAFINMLNKIAHPDKQTVSTVSSEFLKKKLNTVSDSVSFSANRILNSILHSKANIKTEVNESDFVHTNVDIWNLFLSRIENPSFRHSILTQNYFVKYFGRLFNIRDKELLAKVQIVLDSPTLVSGLAAGPLRKIVLPFDAIKPSSAYPVNDSFLKFELNKNICLYVLDSPAGQFAGVRNEVNGLMRVFKKHNKNKPHIHQQLASKIVDEITEGCTQYFNVKQDDDSAAVAGQSCKFKFIECPELALSTTLIINDCQLFDVAHFIDFSFQMITDNVQLGFEFHGVTGEMIFHSESFTKALFKLLVEESKAEGTTNLWLILRHIFNLTSRNNFSLKVFKQCFDEFRGDLFIKLITSTKYTVSVSRHYQTDEVIGYLGSVLSKSLVYYLLSCRTLRGCAEPEMLLKKIVITLDYYLNQHAEMILNKLKDVFTCRIYSDDN